MFTENAALLSAAAEAQELNALISVARLKTIPLSTIKHRYQPGPGRHFFDADTCRFFRSQMPRYGWKGAGGVFFVTSEQFVTGDGIRARRGCTVRQLVPASWDANHMTIRTVGDFNTLGKAEADALAKKLAANF